MSYIYPQLWRVGYVLLDNLEIINANTISSPLTYGFPALTGFTGAIHALSRKLIQAKMGLALDGVVVASHACQVQSHRGAAYKPFSFTQTRNPLTKSGATAPIVEEGRCHLRVSLIIKVYGESIPTDQEGEALCAALYKLVQQQRFASGSVVNLDKVLFKTNLDDLKPLLKPAFVLMDAHQTLEQITAQLQAQDPNKTALDALIETTLLHHNPPDDTHKHWQTTSIKADYGWIVPMPVGFMGIAQLFDAGVLQNSRDTQYPSQYVESVYTLGKWQFASGVALEDAFWYQTYQPESALYLVTQTNNQDN